MSIEKTLAAYTALLGIIKPHAPEAHIAGGAVRDLLNNRPIKDVDVFISDDHTLQVFHALKRAGYHHDSSASPEYFLWETFVTAADTYSGTVFPYPVQVVSLREHKQIEGILTRFDFGLNMAAFDGQQVIQPLQYRADEEQKCFTLQNCRSHEHFLLAQDHYNRLSEKYVDYPMIVPRQFEHFAVQEDFDW